jgi:uncharacterized phage protein (TIGR02220 family)
MKGTGVIYLSEFLGLSSGTISQAMKSLIEIGLIEKLENGYYYPTNKWYLAHEGEEVVTTTAHEDLAKDVIQFFNDINATKYQLHSNIELVKKILKHNSKLTLDHFRSVIVHKKETWGGDDKMKEYNRPSTLFSGKFLKYLDDANHYWLNKQKHDSATQIIGH